MKKTLLVLAIAALGLSACSSLNGKAPHEMVSISVDRSLTKDYSYNFEGQARAFLSDKDKGLAPEIAAEAERKRFGEDTDEAVAAAASEAIAQAAQAAASGEEVSEDESENEAGSAENLGANWGGKGADWAQEYPGITRYLQNVRLNMKGAVDLRGQKIEFIPEIVNNNKNEYASTKMPILLDGKNMTATVDLPGSIPMVLDFLIKDPNLRLRLAEQPVQFAWKDMDEKEIPLKTTLKALVKSSYTAYKALPPEAFKVGLMDEFGKQSGAKHRIDIVWNAANIKAYYEAFDRDFNSEFTRMKQEGMEEGTTEEGYRNVQELIGKLLGRSEPEENASEEQAAESAASAAAAAEAAVSAANAAAEEMGVETDGAVTADDVGQTTSALLKNGNFGIFEDLFGSPYVESIYLDGKGRSVARRSYFQANGKEKALNLEMAIRLNRFGNPVFTFKPQEGKTVTFAELKKGLQSGNGEEEEAPGEEAASGIETPENPNEIKEEAIKE